MMRTNGRDFRGRSDAGFTGLCKYTINPFDVVMHDENGYNVHGRAWFQYGTDGDEHNGSKSNVTLSITRSGRECAG